MHKVLQANCGVFKVLRAFFNVSQKSEPSDNPGIEKKKKKKKSSSSAELAPSCEVLPKPLPIDNEGPPADVEPSDKIMSEPLPPSDKFPRTALLLSAWQMVEENYPIPLNAALKAKYV